MNNDSFSDLINGALYCERFTRSNRLDAIGFDSWLFYPGMLFGSFESWWGEGKPRPLSHEGVDLCLFQTSDCHHMRIGGGALVPALADGVIMKIGDDYLAHSIYVSHSVENSSRTKIYSFYAHVEPASALAPGDRIREGQIVAAIADVETSAPMPPHLHLSLARIHGQLPSTRFDWSTIHNDADIELHDPLHLLGIKKATIPFDPEKKPIHIPLV